MFTITVVRDSGTDLHESEHVFIAEPDSGADELAAHIADCNIKSANIGKQVLHNDMMAVISYDGAVTYLYPGDECCVTNSAGAVVYELKFGPLLIETEEDEDSRPA